MLAGMPSMSCSFNLTASIVFPSSTSSVSVVGDDKSIRSSVGAGVLWASPIGPIRLDLAYPVTKNDYDQTQVFRFSAGSTF